MAFFTLRSIPGSVWPPLPVPVVSLIWAAYQELDRTQWLPAAEIESLQLRQLNALLKHCFEQVPYYTRVLSDAGLGGKEITSLDEFRRVPVLTRELYQEHFDDLQAKNLPDGMQASGKGAYTSGTNGVPIQVLKTNRDDLWWNAFFLRDLEWAGIHPSGKLAVIRLLALSLDKLPRALEGGSIPHWSKICDLLVKTGPCFGIDVRQDPRHQIAFLRKCDPNYLLSMPTNLEFLAGLVEETGGKLPGLQMIQAMGEPLPDEVRQRIEAGFGVPVKDMYSTTEAGYMASPCPSGHGLHVHSENIIAEVLDANDRPCAPGETGRLVFTSLHSFRAPFIRYDILDDVTLAPAPCPCGRGLPLWTRVDGRRHPLLHLPGGRKKSSMGITRGVRVVGSTHQFQIIQRAIDHVVLHVVPDQTWTPEHAQRMRQVVCDEFECEVRVDVEEHPFLQRPRGGKLKIVINEIEDGRNA